MFTDIELFKEERQKFYDKLREINEANISDKDVRVRELNVKFRDDIRKYLPTCLNIINNNYNCHFSIYKVGKDYDSSFNVIETNVKKTRGEIECELTNYRSLLNVNALTDIERERLDLATEIILTYVDDPTEPVDDRDKYLANATPKASSIITNTPRMAQTQVSDSKMDQIQYNPYANQPIEMDESKNSNGDSNIFSSTFANVNTKRLMEESTKEITKTDLTGSIFNLKLDTTVNNSSNRFINMTNGDKEESNDVPTTDNQAMFDLTSRKE